MVILRRTPNIPNKKDKLKLLKKKFKNIMKENIRLYEKNEFYENWNINQ